MNKQKTLKGGINYNTYIWRTSPNACKKCQDLDGLTFNSIDEIPDFPHPNCKCYIDIIEENDVQAIIDTDTNGEKQEKPTDPCYCINLLNELDEIISHINSLREEVRQSIKNIFSKINSKISNEYENLCQKYLDKASNWDNALGDFARNYNDMIEANTIGADKYFHAKANCQAAQRGLTGEYVSQAQSILRELEEGTRKVIFEGEDIVKQYKDAMEDIKANNEGRALGKDYSIRCEVLLKHRRPNGLDDKY